MEFLYNYRSHFNVQVLVEPAEKWPLLIRSHMKYWTYCGSYFHLLLPAKHKCISISYLYCFTFTCTFSSLDGQSNNLVHFFSCKMKYWSTCKHGFIVQQCWISMTSCFYRDLSESTMYMDPWTQFRPKLFSTPKMILSLTNFIFF